MKRGETGPPNARHVLHHCAAYGKGCRQTREKGVGLGSEWLKGGGKADGKWMCGGAGGECGPGIISE
eukprot:350110-Chlamydomonas_euryale.AAC.4